MIRTRFSPSPTGMVHLGNARTALFSALFARGSAGIFLLRIEDTDQTRSEHKYTEQLEEDLRWLGIDWQEGPEVGGPHGPYFQSERAAIYAEYYAKLESIQRAYPCFCSDEELALNRKIQLSRGQPPRYPGTCYQLSVEEISKRIAAGKKPALRFKVPTDLTIEFNDTVKGLQRFRSQDIGDFIIRRADGSASFMFCNAIDDSLMGVTHVLRGEDHLANTPRQIMILQALKMRAPEYGHLSLITNDDSLRLSKRRGSFSLNDLRENGYLSFAVLNYLARLTHTYENQTLLSFDELAKDFRLDKLSRSPARFDKNQLLHWQKEALSALSIEAVLAWLGPDITIKVPADKQTLFAKVMQQNILFPSEAQVWANILFGEGPQLDEEKLAILNDAGADFFAIAGRAVLENGANLENILMALKNTLNIAGKKLYMPLRIILTGETNGPELVHIIEFLGKDETLRRLQYPGK